MLLTACCEFQPASTWRQQWAQTELLLGQIGHVRAVDAAADADQAVVVAALAGPLDLLDHAENLARAALICDASSEGCCVVVVAVVTPAAVVESDVRVGGVHDAVAAYPVFALMSVRFLSCASDGVIGELGNGFQ